MARAVHPDGDLEDEVISRPEHGVTLREMLEALGHREQLQSLLRATELPAYWRGLAERE